MGQPFAGICGGVMGALEEGGKVATSIAESLKSQPLALALVIINLMFLAGGMYTAHDFFLRLDTASLRKDKLVNDMMERCIEMAPPKGDRQ
jgi:hypothetical protein